MPVPSRLIQLLAKPCCRLVVVLFPSPVTAIDPAVVTPVNVFILSVDAITYNSRAVTLASVFLSLIQLLVMLLTKLGLFLCIALF